MGTSPGAISGLFRRAHSVWRYRFSRAAGACGGCPLVSISYSVVTEKAGSDRASEPQVLFCLPGEGAGSATWKGSSSGADAPGVRGSPGRRGGAFRSKHLHFLHVPFHFSSWFAMLLGFFVSCFMFSSFPFPRHLHCHFTLCFSSFSCSLIVFLIIFLIIFHCVLLFSFSSLSCSSSCSCSCF